MAMALLGARAVVLTDQSAVLELLDANIEENRKTHASALAADRVVTQELVWGDMAHALACKDAALDLLKRSASRAEGEKKALEEGASSMLPSSSSASSSSSLASSSPTTLTSANEHSSAASASSSSSAPSSTLTFPFDVVVGSDLIYAHENIPALVDMFKLFCLGIAPPARDERREGGDSSEPQESKGSDSTAQAQVRTVVGYLVAIDRFKWEARFFEAMAGFFRCETAAVVGDISIYRFTPKCSIKEA